MLPEQGFSSRELLTWIEEEVRESLRVKQALLQECVETLAAICAALAERLERGGKLLLFGNGGSAADAQHIAAEFVGRYRCERAAIPAMALTPPCWADAEAARATKARTATTTSGLRAATMIYPPR